MLQEGDKVILFRLSEGRYAVVKSEPIKKGDKALVISIPGKTPIAIKPPKLVPGDKAIVITTPSGKWALKYEAIVNEALKGAIISDIPGKLQENSK